MSGTLLAKSDRVFIIAEAACNHCGDVEVAKEMVHQAKSSGADCIKFQTYIPENLVNPGEEVKKFCEDSRFNPAQIYELMLYCKSIDIGFLSSAFCIESLKILDRLCVDSIKVPSGQIFNEPYLKILGKMKKKVLLSTGMCTMADVERAIFVLRAYGTQKDCITVMQCTTAYPAPAEAANLNVIKTYCDRIAGVRVGYSDHTIGCETAVAAVALGARVIEKHFILDKMPLTPDTCVSMNPEQFSAYVNSIRKTESALGNGKKSPHACEDKMAHRKDVVNL